MADAVRVGVLVPNLFLRVPIEAAVRSAGGVPVSLSGVAAADEAPRLLVVDLEALGDDAAGIVRRLVDAGKDVLAFGPHVRAELLAAARKAGAVVLPRSVFLGRLPALLLAAGGGALGRRAGSGGEGSDGDDENR